MSDLNQDVLSYLATASTSEFYQQDVKILESWEGSDNLLWRVQSGSQEAVLKLFLDAGQARGRRQNDGQERFAPLGIAPRPLWFDRYPYGLSRQVLIYEWVPGAALDSSSADELISFAKAVAKLHVGDPNEVRRFSPHPINLDYYWRVMEGSYAPINEWLNSHNGTELTTIIQSLAARARVLVESSLPLWHGIPPTPVHGDLKFENVLALFGQSVLLDWEMFGLGDPALDVANFLYIEQNALDEETRARWLESYLDTVPEPSLPQRIGIYEALLPLQSVTYLLDGIRIDNGELFAEQSTIDFLKATLSSAIRLSAVKLGHSLDEDLDLHLDQVEWKSH